MKLDKDLVRDILLALEADEGDPRELKNIEVPGWTDEQVAYTVCILAEGGLIEATDLSDMCNWDWRAQRLTYAGHEYVDTIRDGEVWRKTKEVAGKAGAFSLQLLLESGKAIVKQELGKYGVHLP